MSEILKVCENCKHLYGRDCPKEHQEEKILGYGCSMYFEPTSQAIIESEVNKRCVFSMNLNNDCLRW